MLDEIREKIIILKKKFNAIEEKGWIRATSNGRGNIGMTFEKELGIIPNQFEIPDFAGIEIKTKQDDTTPFITLFSATFDGKYLFEMKRIAETYGEFDKFFVDKKILYRAVNSSFFSDVGNGIKFKIDVSYEDKKVYLLVYDCKNKLIERQSYWTFDLLKEKLERKLSYLALVSAKRSFAGDKTYFYYYDIKFMQLKSFDTFLELLDSGKIYVYFKFGVYRSGSRIGNSCDHGTSFDIRRNDLDKLFSHITL